MKQQILKNHIYPAEKKQGEIHLALAKILKTLKQGGGRAGPSEKLRPKKRK
jgi:hypothetical protein